MESNEIIIKRIRKNNENQIMECARRIHMYTDNR